MHIVYALSYIVQSCQVLDLLVLMTLKSYPPDVVASSAAISACAKGHIWLEAPAPGTRDIT